MCQQQLFIHSLFLSLFFSQHKKLKTVIIHVFGAFFSPAVSSAELSVNTAQFAKSAAMLGNSEDHTALSRALSQLAEVEEKIDQLHQDQANADFYLFSELLGDYVRLITAVKVRPRLPVHHVSVVSETQTLITQKLSLSPGTSRFLTMNLVGSSCDCSKCLFRDFVVNGGIIHSFE